MEIFPFCFEEVGKRCPSTETTPSKIQIVRNSKFHLRINSTEITCTTSGQRVLEYIFYICRRSSFNIRFFTMSISIHRKLQISPRVEFLRNSSILFQLNSRNLPIVKLEI